MLDIILHSVMDKNEIRRPLETGSRSLAMESHDSQPDTLLQKTAPDDDDDAE